MSTNMENQLREQGAEDRMDEVLEEIPRVREDLGYIPLVTPPSQIVGTQAVMNVVFGERYKSITKEVAGILKGEYGAAPAELNQSLQDRVLDGDDAITCRPADLLIPEMDNLQSALIAKADEEGFDLAAEVVDDVLTYALFPQVGLKFLAHRGESDQFEAAPGSAEPPATETTAQLTTASGSEHYNVTVNGRSYAVEVAAADGSVTAIKSEAPVTAAPATAPAKSTVQAPLAGSVIRLAVAIGDTVEVGQVVLILEAMKMETEVRSLEGGTVAAVS